MMSTRKFKTLLLLPALSSLLLMACDPLGIKSKGEIVNETRNEQNFQGLDVSVPGKVYVHVGQEYRINVQAEESVLAYLETEVKDGRLHIYFSRHVWDVDDLVIDITAPSYSAFQLSGSGDILVQDPIACNDLNINVSGSGDVIIKEVDAEYFTVNISGSGVVDVDGIATSMTANVSGSGDLLAFDCQVKDAVVAVSGSGKVICSVSEKLEAHISGSGDVEYRGNPSLDTHISGSGKIRKI